MLSLLPTAFYAAGFLALLLLFYQVVKNFGEGRQRRRVPESWIEETPSEC
jgi:hypothetical protein